MPRHDRLTCGTEDDTPPEETAPVQAALLGGVQESWNEKGRTRDGKQLREEEALTRSRSLSAK